MGWYVFVGAIVILIAVAVIATKRSKSFPYGSLAFEAQLSMSPLKLTLAEKKAQRDAADPARAAELDEEIAFLSRQVDEIQAIIDRGDRSPGRGFVGFDPYGSPESSWAKATRKT